MAVQSVEQQQVIYVQQRGNGMAVGAFVCGLVGFVLGLIPILFFIAWALGIVAFVLGLVARRRGKDPNIGRRTMATWGTVLGVLSFGIGVVGYVIVANAFS
jgi:hypothetical protein